MKTNPKYLRIKGAIALLGFSFRYLLNPENTEKHLYRAMKLRHEGMVLVDGYWRSVK